MQHPTIVEINGEAVLIAARKGHAEVCELLIKHGMNKDLTNKYGYTALHLAAYYDRFNVCKVLVENSVKMDLRTTRLSYMPIHFAAKHVSSSQFSIALAGSNTACTVDHHE